MRISQAGLIEDSLGTSINSLTTISCTFDTATVPGSHPNDFPRGNRLDGVPGSALGDRGHHQFSELFCLACV
jgi:hypothetical protein